MDFNAVLVTLEAIGEGIKYTLLTSVCAIIIAMLLGIILWQMLTAKSKLIRGIAICYSKVFRCIPFMIQAYIFYYSLPSMGIKLPAALVGIICLSLYNSAYIGMILESGMRSIPKGQFESCAALGIKRTGMITRIIIPQMIPVVMPPLTGQFIMAVKDSSILSVITVTEMTMMAGQAVNKTFSPFEVYLVLALAYWLLNILIERITGRIEKKAVKKTVVSAAK